MLFTRISGPRERKPGANQFEYVSVVVVSDHGLPDSMVLYAASASTHGSPPSATRAISRNVRGLLRGTSHATIARPITAPVKYRVTTAQPIAKPTSNAYAACRQIGR